MFELLVIYPDGRAVAIGSYETRAAADEAFTAVLEIWTDQEVRMMLEGEMLRSSRDRY